MCVLSACTSHACLLLPGGREEGIRYPGSGVRDAWGSPCGYWERNLVPCSAKETSALIHCRISPASPVFFLRHDLMQPRLAFDLRVAEEDFGLLILYLPGAGITACGAIPGL